MRGYGGGVSSDEMKKLGAPGASGTRDDPPVERRAERSLVTAGHERPTPGRVVPRLSRRPHRIEQPARGDASAVPSLVVLTTEPFQPSRVHSWRGVGLLGNDADARHHRPAAVPGAPPEDLSPDRNGVLRVHAEVGSHRIIPQSWRVRPDSGKLERPNQRKLDVRYATLIDGLLVSILRRGSSTCPPTVKW